MGMDRERRSALRSDYGHKQFVDQLWWLHFLATLSARYSAHVAMLSPRRVPSGLASPAHNSLYITNN